MRDKIFWDWEKTLCVTWEITARCNLRCSFCEVIKQKKKDLSFENITGILDILSELRSCHITWTGGEPFIRKDFPEISRYASDKNLYQGICTNGTLITEKTLLEVDFSGIQWIMFSVDGPTPRIHDMLRNSPGAFEKVKQSIKLIISERKSNKLPRIKIHSVINEHNLGNVRKIIQLADELAVDEIQLKPEFSKNSPPKEMIIEQLCSKLKKNFHNYKFAIDIDLLMRFNTKVPYAETRGISCVTGKNLIHIDASGRLYPCCILAQSKSVSPVKVENNFVGLRDSGELKRLMEKQREVYRKDHWNDPCKPCWLKSNQLFIDQINKKLT